MLWPEFQLANPGFAHDFQLIDVQDFNGVGESEPNPYFYQVSHKIVVLKLEYIVSIAMEINPLMITFYNDEPLQWSVLQKDDWYNDEILWSNHKFYQTYPP